MSEAAEESRNKAPSSLYHPSITALMLLVATLDLGIKECSAEDVGVFCAVAPRLRRRR